MAVAAVVVAVVAAVVEVFAAVVVVVAAVVVVAVASEINIIKKLSQISSSFRLLTSTLVHLNKMPCQLLFSCQFRTGFIQARLCKNSRTFQGLLKDFPTASRTEN